MSDTSANLAELRKMWERRRANAAPFRALVDPTGMTRPARDPEEREFLAERNGLGPFVEVDDPTYRIWRTGKYGTAAEVKAKWARGELGPEHDPWNQLNAPALPETESTADPGSAEQPGTA